MYFLFIYYMSWLCVIQFIDLFNYSNQHHREKNIIICNSDIIFDHTLYKLEHIDFKDKLYALTRWDYIDETTAKPRFQKDKIMKDIKSAFPDAKLIDIKED